MNYINKTKKYFIDSLKFIAFICFLKGIQGFWVNIFLTFPVHIENEFITIIAIVAILYLRTIVHFFIAKRLGIIQFFNKKPLLISLIVTYAIDYFVTYTNPFYNYDEQYWFFSTPTSIIVFFFLTITFTSLYVIYKIAKGLSKKFSWIKKLYPQFLDKLSNTKSIFLVLLICFYRLKHPILIEGSIEEIIQNRFLYIAIAIFIIFFIYSFIQDAIQFFKSKKHIAIKNKIEELYNKTYLRVKNKETTFPALVKEILSYEIKIKKK